MLLPHLCNKKHWELLYFNHLVSCRSQLVHIFSTGGHHRGHFITLSCIKGHPSEHCTMFYLPQRHPKMGGTRGQCPPPAIFEFATAAVYRFLKRSHFSIYESFHNIATFDSQNKENLKQICLIPVTYFST